MKLHTLLEKAEQDLRDKYLLRLGGFTTSTGIRSLDALLDGGLTRGEYTVLGALSGHGKTTLAMQFARYAAEVDPESAVVFCSPEMRNDALAQMELCALMGHAMHQILRQPSLLEKAPGVRKTAADNVFLASMPRGSHIDALTQTVRGISELQPVSLVVIDYAQFVLGRLDQGKRQRFALAQDIVEACEDIARIRTQGKMPAVLLTSQVNAVRDKGKVTDLTLRESALFEHGASAVMFFVREFDGDGNEAGAYFRVTKSRHGRLGKLEVETNPGHYWVREKTIVPETWNAGG